MVAQEDLHHGLRAMGVDDQHGAVAVVEHPQPPVRAADPTPVSSDAMVVPPSRRALMSDTAALNGAAPADSTLTSAPSLIDRPNRSRSASRNHVGRIPWTARR